VINKKAVGESIILFVFALFMIVIVLTGKISLYVHPRMNIYILLCGIYFIILASSNIGNFRIGHTHKTFNVTLIIFIIPIILVLFTKNASVNANIVKNKGVNMSRVSAEQTNKPSTSTNASSDSTKLSSQNASNSNTQSQSSVENSQDTVNSIPEVDNVEIPKGLIKIDENNFMRIFNEFSANIDKYKGREVEMCGFVFRQKDFQTNNFVIGRYCMICCAADLQIVGFMCDNKKDSSQLKDNTWLKIKGKLDEVTYNGEEMPVIKIEHVEKTQKPENEYVYPY